MSRKPKSDLRTVAMAKAIILRKYIKDLIFVVPGWYDTGNEKSDMEEKDA
ncbi:MAG: hypothetical protein K2P66_03605 [Lachnospiraceae bacterium]|nr:hypothetical protein [Lachnospiraceae bacterium]